MPPPTIGCPLPEPTGDTTGDTTEYLSKLRQQEALLTTGARQSAIFNSANFSSIATDAKGVIQIFNVGAARMLGYAAGDVINKITPADLSDRQELIERAAALSNELGIVIAPGFEALAFKASRGIEDIYELTYVRKDGSRLPAIVSVTALRDAHDSVIGYLLIGTDNTARKQLADELHLEALVLSRTAELAHSRDVAQAASRAKSMFLANMNHEIRTPMNAILGLSYLALATPLADETRNYIQKVHNAAENLLGIINGILDFLKAMGVVEFDSISPETRLTNASFITKSSRFSANAGCRQVPGMLMNGMHITVLTTVADDPRTMLSVGLAPQRSQPLRARTNALSVISALPFTLYRKIVSPRTSCADRSMGCSQETKPSALRNSCRRSVSSRTPAPATGLECS